MSILQDFVNELSDEQCIQIVKDHEIYETAGAIGSCELRNQTKIFCDKYSITGNVLFMNQMVFEVFRKIAMRDSVLFVIK